MPVEPVLLLIVAAVIANLAVMAVILIPPLLGRSSPIARDVAPGVDRRAARGRGRRRRRDRGRRPPRTASPTQTYDRVVRIVAWVFLLATTVIVAATGLWPDDPAGDPGPARPVRRCSSSSSTTCCPPDALGPAKFVVEGSVAITVATLLVALTGGVASPFFFAFPLIVAGAALVVSPTITVALAGCGRARLRARGHRGLAGGQPRAGHRADRRRST